MSQSLSLRPREKLARYSVQQLSLHELLQAVVGKGIAGYPVRRVARLLLKDIHRSGRLPSYDRLLQLPGIGQATAARMTAAYELSQRLRKESASIVDAPSSRMIHYWLYGQSDRVVAQGRLNTQRTAQARAIRLLIAACVSQLAIHVELEVHDYWEISRPDANDRELAQLVKTSCQLLGVGIRRYDFYHDDQKVSLL